MLRGLKSSPCRAAAKARICAWSKRSQAASLRRAPNSARSSKSCRYAATVWALTRRSSARWDRNRSIHARSVEPMNPPRPSAHQGVGHELADTREKLRAHGRVEALGVARADGQDSEFTLGAQRGQGHRADLERVRAEKIVALRVADLSAARLARLQQRLEGLDVGVRRSSGAQKSARHAFHGPRLLEEQHHHRMH